MKKIYHKGLAFWDRYEKPIKLIFVSSMVLFVIVALIMFGHDVKWDQVGVQLQRQSWDHLIILTIGGIIAVVPMLGYDVTITRLLPGKFSPDYIIQSGWVTNTLTNIAGFGGVLGSSLRAYFYSKDADRKQILNAISKISIFLASGLSIICWLALFIMFGLHDGGHFNRYAIWLVLGGLYSPAMIIFTRYQGDTLFKDLSWKLESFVVGSSILEWLGVTLFFVLVGWALHVHINLLAVVPLYIVAQIIGALSMIPGAIGSFDVIMMVELVMLGVDRPTAVAWLLLFRFFYYIVPLVLGGILFTHRIVTNFNEHFNHLPGQIFHQNMYFLGTGLMYLTGIIMLVAASVPDLTDSNKFLQKFYPFTFFLLHQLSTIVFAIAILACARGLQARVKKAFCPTMIVLLIGMFNALFNLALPALAGYILILLVIVWGMRASLYRYKLQYSMGKFIFDGVIFAGSFLLYVVVGVVNTPNYESDHVIPDYLLFPGEHIWLSGFIGLLIGIAIMLLILHYFTRYADPFKNDQVFPRDRVDQVIAQFGGNETSHLAYLQDKNIYFYQAEGQDRLFFMYRKKYDKLIVMGTPVGDREVWQAAIHQLVNEADLYGYLPVFYEVDSQVTMLLHEYGFDFLKTGEDGIVKLADFTLAGKKQRSQRALMHKFEREEYQFSVVEPPFDQDLMKELKAVSDDWLGNQVEKGFSLGFFSEQYLNEAPIGIVRDVNGFLVAFVTSMPTGGKEILTIDLMRHSHQAPSGIMDLLFIKMFEYGQNNGYEYFDLGMAPLSNVGQSQFSFTEEKMAHFIYEYGYRLYGFQGLRRYKEKYASKWLPRYTVYRKKQSLIATMVALVSVVNQRAK